MKKRFFAGRLIYLWAGVILCVALITLALVFYRNNLLKDLETSNCSSLSNVLKQQQLSFESKVNDEKTDINMYAELFEELPPADNGDIVERLETITKNSSGDTFLYSDINGNAISNKAAFSNISSFEFFNEVLNDNEIIAGPLSLNGLESNSIVIASPIHKDGVVSGVLAGIYSDTIISDILVPSFGGVSCTYIVNAQGEIIFSTKTPDAISNKDNIFTFIKNSEHQKYDNADEIVAKAATNKGGHSLYILNKQLRLMHFIPLEINDWSIFLIAPNGSVNPQSINTMYTATLFILLVALFIAGIFAYILISQRGHMQELKKIAFVDALTGVPNKRKFKISATTLLSRNEYQYAFVIIDIDKFKVLNDSLGYNNGDVLLVDIAKIIKKNLMEYECFGRCDSDEYLLLLRCDSSDELKVRILALLNEIKEHFNSQINGGYRLVLCAGVCLITSLTESIDSISDKARHAHKLVKGKDENGVAFYDEEIRFRLLEEREIENKMYDALLKEEFMLYLQPKYYLDTGKIYGAEALVRWKNADLSITYPGQFISVFERNGFITKLDMYMLEKACQTLRHWIDDGKNAIPISINFSRLHLKNLNFVNDIAKIVEKYSIPPELIEVEITESSMLDNEDMLALMLEHLHEHGFILSMDDFGSGYSSLGLLKNLPFDVIKLDRTFFVDYNHLGRAVTVVGSMISMAKALGIKTVAEGVETLEQINFLKELGCDIVQGYYFARPMPAISLDEFLEK